MTSTINIASSNGLAAVAIDTESTNHGVQVWGNSFEKLLEDASGLHTFAEFLKKEFSAENIYFWTACERYRKLTDHNERTKEANAIFSKHLATGASEPVNVDSKARTLAQDGLNYAKPDLFLQVIFVVCVHVFASLLFLTASLNFLTFAVYILKVNVCVFFHHFAPRHKSKYST